MRSVVVFPAPSGPTSPNTSPRATSRFRPSTATSEPNRRVRLRMQIMSDLPHDLSIDRHVGFQVAIRVLDFYLDAIHELHTLFRCLDLLGRELRLGCDEG